MSDVGTLERSLLVIVSIMIPGRGRCRGGPSWNHSPPRRPRKSVGHWDVSGRTSSLTNLLRWSTSIHENGELGYGLSKKDLCIWVLEEGILPMRILIVTMVRIRTMVEVGGVVLERRRVPWIVCEGLVGLVEESNRQRRGRGEVGIGAVHAAWGIILSPDVAR